MSLAGPASSRSRPPDIATGPTQASLLVTFPSEPIPSPTPTSPSRPFLPFRRISLPADHSQSYRESLANLKNIDSFPEEQHDVQVGTPPEQKQLSAIKSGKPRPTSMSGPARTRVRAESRRRRTEVHMISEKDIKRRSVVAEILATERAYVDGLDLIYELFLMPLVEALEINQPILSHPEVHSIFNNFIDIWNSHRSFLSSLTAAISASPTPEVQLAPLLAEHFPYLSLYTPFITSFPDAVAALSSLSGSNPTFSTFLKTQQANPRCKALSLRDWLLTIVQRCPRYLLLLKDLVSCTDPSSEEYEGLSRVHALVAKITSALNTSLHTHSQTLLLLAIQRSTSNLPFQLVAPGRSLEKRGTLLKVDREQRLLDFLLLSDTLIWLSKSSDPQDSSSTPIPVPMSANPKRSSAGLAMLHQSQSARPSLGPRARSKSDADLPKWRSSDALSPPIAGDKWTYSGQCNLVDIQVVVSTMPGPGEERKFDVFGPLESFAVYASSMEERDVWVTAIRNAKAAQLLNLNVTHPNSTLTSSTSNAHIRKTLQALPHLPEDDKEDDVVPEVVTGKKKRRKKEKRGKVEHFVPPVWIPDAKTDSCMRCTRMFGILRRRHHCRLCGRVVCADCSSRTFFISDPTEPKKTKPSRSCNACYETVFPLLPTPPCSSPLPAIPSSNSTTSLPPAPSSKRRSAMHVPTLPDIPSLQSLARAEGDDDSPRSLPDPLPLMSSSLPVQPLPRSDSSSQLFKVPQPPNISRMSTSTESSNPNPEAESIQKFTLPIPLPPPTAFKMPRGPSWSVSTEELILDEGLDPTDGVRRRSRSSIPALRDSFYRSSRDDLEELVSELGNLDNGSKEVIGSAPKRRITFAPSSAIHRAPVTIYPQASNDGSKRFSLVLTGKGTVGRGAGLDVGSGPSNEHLPETPETPNGSPSPLSDEPVVPESPATRSRRGVFDGLEKGVAASKLNRLLGRSKKTAS